MWYSILCWKINRFHISCILFCIMPVLYYACLCDLMLVLVTNCFPQILQECAKCQWEYCTYLFSCHLALKLVTSHTISDQFFIFALLFQIILIFFPCPCPHPCPLILPVLFYVCPCPHIPHVLPPTFALILTLKKCKIEGKGKRWGQNMGEMGARAKKRAKS